MEHSFIAWAKQRVARLPQVALGIGDDAAVLQTDGDMVVTSDSLCEGTHFLLDSCGPRAVGRKLAGVNLSDLAAMAATPTAFIVSLCLPRDVRHFTRSDCQATSSIAIEIFEGICEYAARYHVAIAGGDTNTWDGPLCVNITAIGKAPAHGVWKRSGARPGDAIVVSGQLGGSIRDKHLTFEPRLDLATELYNRFSIHAATDITDGLAIDLLSLFSSSGCGAELSLEKIPISQDAHAMSTESGRSPLQHALEDGEDFELLLAIPPDVARALPSSVAGIPLTVIGNFVSRTGLWVRDKGKLRQLSTKGYTH